MNSENLNFEIRSLQSEEADQIRILININEDYFKKFAVRNSNFNIRHYWAWDVMNTITAFYNMFERFLPCAKSNLHVLWQKMRDFYNNVMKKKYRKKNVSVCWEMWGVSVCVVIGNSDFNIRHHWAWDVMDTITAFYNMFERFLPSAKSNLHVLRQKSAWFLQQCDEKKSIERKMCRCVERCEAWAFVLLSLSSTFSQHNLHIKSETFF